MNAKPLLVGLVVCWCCVLSQAQSDSHPKTAAEQLNQQWSRGQAEGRGPVKLATFPLRVEDISHINPMGMMASGHTTPTDHLYRPDRPRQGADPRARDLLQLRLHLQGLARRLENAQRRTRQTQSRTGPAAPKNRLGDGDELRKVRCEVRQAMSRA